MRRLLIPRALVRNCEYDEYGSIGVLRYNRRTPAILTYNQGAWNGQRNRIRSRSCAESPPAYARLAAGRAQLVLVCHQRTLDSDSDYAAATSGRADRRCRVQRNHAWPDSSDRRIGLNDCSASVWRLERSSADALGPAQTICGGRYNWQH